ncbi:hypothetical protein FB45DRAFT_904855, partial [Roridomyces roridus]
MAQLVHPCPQGFPKTDLVSSPSLASLCASNENTIQRPRPRHRSSETQFSAREHLIGDRLMDVGPYARSSHCSIWHVTTCINPSTARLRSCVGFLPCTLLHEEAVARSLRSSSMASCLIRSHRQTQTRYVCSRTGCPAALGLIDGGWMFWWWSGFHNYYTLPLYHVV